jgi:hypothetical protein
VPLPKFCQGMARRQWEGGRRNRDLEGSVEDVAFIAIHHFQAQLDPQISSRLPDLTQRRAAVLPALAASRPGVLGL